MLIADERMCEWAPAQDIFWRTLAADSPFLIIVCFRLASKRKKHIAPLVRPRLQHTTDEERLTHPQTDSRQRTFSSSTQAPTRP